MFAFHLEQRLYILSGKRNMENVVYISTSLIAGVSWQGLFPGSRLHLISFPELVAFQMNFPIIILKVVWNVQCRMSNVNVKLLLFSNSVSGNCITSLCLREGFIMIIDNRAAYGNNVESFQEWLFRQWMTKTGSVLVAVRRFGRKDWHSFDSRGQYCTMVSNPFGII